MRSAPRPPLDEPAARAERIAAMLDRWRSEDISDEPDWDPEDVARVRLRDDDPRKANPA